MTDNFKLAREKISPSLIMSFFPDGEEKIDQWVIKSPLRTDNKAGSFNIDLETGVYYDHARPDHKGSFIDLIAEVNSIEPIDAAKKIISASGEVVYTENIVKPKKTKPDAIIPIPESANILLKKRLNSDWSIKNNGNCEEVYPYFDKDNNLLFYVARHVKDDKKITPQYYFTVENKWKMGLPKQYSKLRPLYGLHKLKNLKRTSKILIVEGEKCGNVEVKGYTVISWVGGSPAVGKADWTALDKFDDITIWRDNDEPGKKCCDYLKNRFSQVKELNIPSDKPLTWDLYDAVEQGINPVDFIKDYTKTDIIEKKSKKDNLLNNVIPHESFFSFLGWDESNHYFLRNGAEIPIKAARSRIPNDLLFELADYDWWLANFQTPTKNPKLDNTIAKNWLIQTSIKSGKFNSEILRGAGCWKDGNNYLINDGNRLIVHGKSQPTKYAEYESQKGYVYIMSHAQMDNFIGEEAEQDDCLKLLGLFNEAGFRTDLQAITAMGWSLTAPFGAALDWRPHIWVTGESASGKSYIMRTLIKPIVGKFALKGSGTSTEAGNRRSLGDGRPVVNDEMESVNDDDERKIKANVNLARNCSCDDSAGSVMAKGADGVERFEGRSMFCFASVVPVLGDNQANDSRFTVCEVKRVYGEEFEARKKIFGDALSKGLLDNPERYLRRLWNKFDIFVDNIKKISNYILKITGDQRYSDQKGIPVAAVYTLCIDEDFNENETWQNLVSEFINNDDNDIENDFDRLINEILQSHIRTDENLTKSIAQVMVEYKEDKFNVSNRYLSNYGMKIVMHKNDPCLAFQVSSKQLGRILRDTPFKERYRSILTRHKFYIGKTAVSYNGHNQHSILLDWCEFKEKYIRGEND